MARVEPFHALEFARDAGPLGELLSPPYDVLYAADREKLLARNPKNAVVLDLISPAADSDPERHRKSRATMDRWIADGTLVESTAPRMFVVEDAFDGPNGPERRLGLICTVGMEKLGAGSILPHERVLDTPIQDRLQLLTATRAHLSPVFFVCDDPSRALVADLRALCAAQTPDSFDGIYPGLSHRMWTIEDPAALARLTALFADRTLLIADGHHRYQTAWIFSQQEDNRGMRDAGSMLAYVSFYPSDGLALRAFHRLARADVPVATLIERLRPMFDVRSAPLDEAAFAQDAAPLALADYAAKTMHVLAPGAAFDLVEPVLRDIPSVVLNSVLKAHLAIDLTDPEQQKNVQFFFDAGALARAAGPGKIAFWLKPVSIPAVFQAARRGFVLPQKSTYFYPKVPTGLAFHRIRG